MTVYDSAAGLSLLIQPRRQPSCNPSISALDPSWSGRYLPAAFQPLSLAKTRGIPVAAFQGVRAGGRGGMSTLAETRNPIGLRISACGCYRGRRAVGIFETGIQQPAGGRTRKGGQ